MIHGPQAHLRSHNHDDSKFSSRKVYRDRAVEAVKTAPPLMADYMETHKRHDVQTL